MIRPWDGERAWLVDREEIVLLVESESGHQKLHIVNVDIAIDLERRLRSAERLLVRVYDDGYNKLLPTVSGEIKAHLDNAKEADNDAA